MNFFIDLVYLTPEVLVTVGAFGCLALGLVKTRPGLILGLGGFTIVGAGLSEVLIWRGIAHAKLVELKLFGGMACLDPYAVFAKMVMLIAVGMVILMAHDDQGLPQRWRAEFFGLLLFVTASVMLFVSTTHLLMLYVALEFLSVVSYVLVGFLKTEARSGEAAIKYFLIGSASSGLILYGISWLFGLAGSLSLEEIRNALMQVERQPIVYVALAFLLAGLGFKMAIVPFHMWCPDVYEGAPTPITAFLSVVSKGSSLAVLIRVLLTLFGLSHEQWATLIGGLAALTMTVGNITAIAQRNIKRMLAYSSIAHAGYFLMGLAVTGPSGQAAMLFYLVAYLFMNLGAFAVVIYVANVRKTEEIRDYAGLGSTSPGLAFCLVLFLMSLTGLPPLAGFVGKFLLFASVLQAKIYWLAIVAGVNSIVAAYYYFRVIRFMYLKEAPSREPVVAVPALTCAILIALVGTILIGLFPIPGIISATRALLVLGS